MQREVLFPVKAVVKRTGLSPHTIRVWERRYGVVAPRRSSTNRRLYNEPEVHRLLLLKMAVDAGHAIGQIAGLTDEELSGLSGEQESLLGLAGGETGGGKAESASELLGRALAAAHALDAGELETVLQAAAVKLSRRSLVEDFVVPLVEQVGDLWQRGELRIAQEHMTTGVVRTFLGGFLHRARMPSNAPHIVVATPSGQVHELGALIVAVVAVFCGWRATYLGADLPAEEIASAVMRGRVRAVALSLVYPAGEAGVALEISRIRQYVPPQVRVLIGGKAASSYLPMVEAANILAVPSIAGLQDILASLARGPEQGPA